MNEIIKEAKERWNLCNDAENQFRSRFKEDYKFAHGDADNGFQWDQKDRMSRQIDRKPALTINKTRQHNLNIINDATQNKPGIKYMPSGGGASFESAQVWMALARRIEANSSAGDAYTTGIDRMVQGGFGYARVVTDYVASDSFEQQLLIKRVPDPLKVFLDPDAQERDKSDSNYGFVFEDMHRQEFNRKYPELARQAQVGGLQNSSWISDKLVRKAEYFRAVETKDILWQYFPEDGPPFTGYESELAADVVAQWKKDPLRARKRKTTRRVIEWYYIVGDYVVDENIWPGSIIPIIPFIAEEVVIDGKIDRKSHTRALKDPQRMYNWWSSAGIEYGALQTKVPWLAAAEAIEGREQDWATANVQTKSVLTYNAYNEEGEPIPPPQRIEPPVAAPVALTGMEVASREMAMVSGQYEAQMGAPSNERSGKAINERQRMGDRSTYHYIDATAVAIRLIGRIILDTARKIYQPGQIIQILAEDGETQEVRIDPEAQQAFKIEQDENNEIVARIFNPNIGQYDVIADVGPGYATRREETFNALVLLLTQAPQLANVIGDLLFRAGDFMYSDEAAQRLRRMVPREALGKGPSQQEQMLMMQLEQLKGLIAKLQQENAEAKVKLKGRDEKRDIDIYNAFTNRFKVIQDGGLAEQDRAMATVQLMRDLMNDSLEASQTSIDKKLEQQLVEMEQAESGMPAGMPAGMPEGAKQAPDGHHYVPDPLRPGKFMKVVQEGSENAGQG